MNYVTMNAFEMNYFRMLSDVAFANMSGREMEGGREERGSERRRRRREEEEEVFGRERGVDVSKRLYQHGEFSALSIMCKGIFVSKVSLLLLSQKRIGGNLNGWQPNLNYPSSFSLKLLFSLPFLSFFSLPNGERVHTPPVPRYLLRNGGVPHDSNAKFGCQKVP